MDDVCTTRQVFVRGTVSLIRQRAAAGKLRIQRQAVWAGVEGRCGGQCWWVWVCLVLLQAENSSLCGR